MLTSYRITKRRHAENAFDGEGARIAGGRWNSPGTRIVYTAGTIALAALEILVHLDHAAPLAAYMVFTCTFDDALVADPGKLPEAWSVLPTTADAQRVGDTWSHGLASAILRVPSAVIAEESNYLFNPLHGDFSKIRISAPRAFSFDPRLIRR
jgi:RES domain-containing protein